MALSFKTFSVFLILSTFVASQGEKPRSKAAIDLQADVCELLLDHSAEENSIRYPNEFYDCTAHGRYFKDASLAAPLDRPFPG